MLRALKIVMGLFLPVMAQAGQLVPTSNNGEATAQIARSGLSRIYVKEDHITQITSLNGELMIQKDLENGQLFVKPLDETRERAIDVFISTEKGNQFSLSLKPLAIKSQSIGIYLEEETKRRDEEDANVLVFIKELRQKTEMDDNSLIEEKGQVLSISPYKLIKAQTFNQGKLIGEVYFVANNHPEKLKIEQRNFWQEGVKAVAIERERLSAGEATKVYVVKNNGYC